MKKDCKDYYGILEVSPRASVEVIKAAYKAMKSKFGNDQDVLDQIKEAYSVLTNKDMRDQYDTEIGKQGDLFESEYEIISHIAESEHGDVYVAKHLLTGEKVCVKHCRFVSPQHEELLIKEARTIWDLSHHGIAFARDLKKLKDGSLALIMRYIPGLTLKEVVKKTGMMEAEDVMRITERLINTLSYLHFNGTVHGGIEPKNIILNPKTYDVTLVGCSLSMVKPKSGDKSTGYIEHFSPPEQKRFEVLMPESDFYSLGMVMIYMLGGGMKAVQKMEIPKETPELICEFIRELIQRDMDDRPDWDYMDLFKEVKSLRIECFGREHTNRRSIPGLED